MEGESRPASVRDQVVVRVRGEFGKIINGDGEGMPGEVMSLGRHRVSLCSAIVASFYCFWSKLHSGLLIFCLVFMSECD